MGSTYKRGSNYWIKYYRNVELYRESSKSKKANVKRLLRKRVGEIVPVRGRGIKKFSQCKCIDSMQRNFARIVRPWIAELVIHGPLPERIGRYRILDCLSAWENGDGIHSK